VEPKLHWKQKGECRETIRNILISGETIRNIIEYSFSILSFSKKYDLLSTNIGHLDKSANN